MGKKEFAKGIFITEKTSKGGITYLDINLAVDGGYKKYVAFKGSKEGKYGGLMYSVYDKTQSETTSPHEDKNLPF